MTIGHDPIGKSRLTQLSLPPVFERRLTLALFPIVSVAALLPLLAVTIPPLHDYPFHLARADAIAALFGQTSHPTHYALGSFLLPNVAMDVVTLGLTAFMPPLLAGRVFLGLVVLLMVSGTAALHRALHGRLSPWPLLAAFFLYNWIYLYGFTNYLFGIGMTLWGVALWRAMRRTALVPRLLAGSILAVAILFCHLVAFGLFAVILGGLALTDAFMFWRRNGQFALVPLLARLLPPSVPLAIALAVFVAVSPTAGQVREPITYFAWIGWKPLMAWRTLTGPIPWLDLATIGPLLAMLVLAAALRQLRLAPVMILPIALLALTFVVMPYGLFGSLYADARLPIAVLMVVIAALDVRPLKPLTLVFSTALALGLLVARDAVIARDWIAQAPVIAEYQTAFDTIPAGGILYVASAEPYPKLAWDSPEELARWHPPLKHLASLASIGRDLFVPSTWADPFKQPIHARPEDAKPRQLQGDNPFLTPTAAALADVVTRIRALREPGAAPKDYLLLLRPEALTGTPPSGLEPIARGATFQLFRIE
jgi:hypothetical protein